MNENLRKQLIRHEGINLTAYRCPAGYVTVGIGHNLEANPVPGIPCKIGHTITDDQAKRLFEADVAMFAEQIDKRWSWARDMGETRYCVLINMAFNMGVDRLAGFKQALAAMQRGDYDTAAVEILDSANYGRSPYPGVRKRALEMSEQMRTGVWA